jgi:hypothetical protein
VRPPSWTNGSLFVWFINVEPREPVFHRVRRMEGPEWPYRVRMRCGVTDVNQQGLTARLRIDQALKIGRPCRICFPDAPRASSVV